MKIAILGLGLLGTEIALRLNQQGFDVTGWNRGAAGAQSARDRGLIVSSDLVEVLVSADLVLLVLSDADAISQTLFDDAGVASALKGRVLVQMGTIAPDESRALAERALALGARYLESPVLGSLPEAREGRLILMAGGDPALFEHCLPVLRVLGQAPALIGPVGQGAALKLAMNQLIAGLTASFSLSLGLIRREGIDVDQFMTLLRGSALYAQTFDKKLDKYLSHSYGVANFPLKHLLKDVRLFRHVAEDLGMDGTLMTTIESACVRGESAGFADQDYAALYEALVDTGTGGTH